MSSLRDSTATKRGREESQNSLKDSPTENVELLQTDDFLYDPRYQ
jgi:hypothetical protein